MEQLAPAQWALLDIAAAICGAVDTEAANAVAARITGGGEGQTASSYFRELKVKADRTDELQTRNEALCRQVKDLLKELQDSRSGRAEGEVRQGIGTVPAAMPSNRSFSIPDEDAIRGAPPAPTSLDEVESQGPESVAMMKEKFRKLQYNFDLVDEARKTWVAKLREAKSRLGEWRDYAATLETKLKEMDKQVKLKKKEADGQSSIASHSKRETHEDVQEAGQQASSEEFMVDEFCARQGSLPDGKQADNCENDVYCRLPMPLARHTGLDQQLHHSRLLPDDVNLDGQHFGSGTTESDPAENHVDEVDAVESQPFIKEESPDLPIVVSSRVIRRAAANHQKRIKAEALSSSSPIGIARTELLYPQESMDLDEDSHKGITPKKRRQDEARHQVRTKKQRLANFNSLQAAGAQGAEPEYDFTTTTVKQDEEDGVNIVHGRILAPQKRTALQPKSPNKVVLPRTTLKTYSKKKQKEEDAVRGAVLLGEDGETQSQAKASKVLNSAEVIRRLGGLLENPSPQRRVLTPAQRQAFSRVEEESPSVARGSTGPIRRGDEPVRKIPSENTALKAGQVSRTPLNRFPRRPESIATPASEPTSRRRGLKPAEDVITLEADDPDHEPFRARPLRKLALEHFKINPAYNQGYNYAFTDVVRGREQRRCLDGCTKPECCGDKFRAMVEFIREDQVPTLSQEDADRQLLEDFMGENKGKLRSITNDEKQELLMQAKARELSKKHGRHKNAYERRKSPPGFWRTDFPSTQEADDDRKKADSFLRDLVQKRYEEAMRSDGKWLFRDE